MTFDEILTQVLELLRREGRVSYRALKRRFDLDEDYLEDLKAEIIQAKKLAVDEDSAVLVWTGDAAMAAAPSGDQERSPLSYTPAYLTEKILTSRAALEGERKQVTVLFADLKGSTELIEGLDPEEARHAPGSGSARHDGCRAALRRYREPGARGRYHGALRGSSGP
jgi:hypothetical protein